jgi:DNA-binding MarR family transcriptional regulator
MLPFDFEESVGHWIFSTAHRLAHEMNQELQAHGITYRQWEVLAWLSYAGEMPQSEMAERMGIEAPTLVGVLDRMERDGWIERITDDADRRKKIIRAAPRVEPVWNKMVECRLRVRARAIEGLSAQRLAALRDTLAIIRRNLGEKANPTAADGRNPLTAIDGR